MTSKRKLLRVEAPHYTAGVVWEHQGSGVGWKPCANECAPILRWVLQVPTYRILRHLQSRGYRYQWLPVNDPEATA